mmetsp:Transcript_39768/g.68190  ORF Transcript_39768/g.68190 Transcript_39768/m.68190 type:complete len:456 (+) Transcript_39768:79-1446(+)
MFATVTVANIAHGTHTRPARAMAESWHERAREHALDQRGARHERGRAARGAVGAQSEAAAPRPAPAPGRASLSGCERLLKLLGPRVLGQLDDEVLPLEVRLDRLEHLQLLFVVDQVQGHPLLAEATRAADAVQVRLRVVHAPLFDRHVVLDDERDGGDVDAAREHVGGDQEARRSRAEIEQHLVARRLLHAAVERRDRVAVLLEHPRQRLDRLPRVHEDDALPDRHGVEDLRQPRLLLLLPVALVEHLPHLVVEDVLALHLNLRPVVLRQRRECLRKLFDRVGPRGGEEEHLALLWQLLTDALRGVAEAPEGEHLVRLVEDEHAHGRGVQHAHVDQGPHLARRAHDDLLLHRVAALIPLLAQHGLDGDTGLDEQVLAHLHHLLHNLLRQLARRAEADRLRRRLRRHDLEHPEDEAARLARAIVRLCEQVSPGPDLGERGSLDLGGPREVHLIQTL